MQHSTESDGRLIRLVLRAGLFFALALAALLAASVPALTRAETPEEIQQKIIEQNEKIAQLEKEIAQYEKELLSIGTAKKTLENEVKQLDLSRKKINANISVTEGKINETNLEIRTLSGEIGNKEEHIAKNKDAVLQSFRTVYKIGDTTLVEHLLASSGLEEAWSQIDNLRTLEQALKEKTQELLETKEELEVDKDESEKKQRQLTALRRELANQRLVLDQNRKEQQDLLNQTKNRESSYQTLLQEKQEAKAQFERQLSDYEAALKFNLDPTSIPKAGTGVLSFPLDPEYMTRCKDRSKTYGNIYCITQYFGDTEFARSGAYRGKGHNGLDFGAPSGTKVVSALSGTVVATGNTDQYRGCYSYGKWVLVKHLNGLSTLYSHLSVISVNSGDAVGRGSLIGYSGQTGYATGPHLHFTVYVADAVKVVRYGDVNKSTNCPNAYIPVAPTEAYLNPFSYL